LRDAIFNAMAFANSLPARAVALVGLVAAVVLSSAPAPALAASSATHARVSVHTLMQSRLLWATIDVCDPTDQPNTVGIRGSMPGDGDASDTMFMRFQVQSMNKTTNHWTNPASGASSGFVKVGSGASPRQGGRTFTFGSSAEKAAFTLRGVVVFQWRHGSTVVASTSRTTSAGRQSLAGADPAGFSAATCVIH
jgi:hypothetical protein